MCPITICRQNKPHDIVPVEARFALVLFVMLVALSVIQATNLNQQTIKAWDTYIQETNSRLEKRLANSAFLWIDEVPERRARVLRGEIVVEPASKNIPEKVPQGLIHDWLGAAFIPGATIDGVFAFLNNYGRYAEFYKPAVIGATLLEDSGETKKFSLLLAQKVPFVTAAISSEYISKTVRLDEQRWYTVTYSTQMQQINNYGEPGERKLPPDTGTGFIWRLYSIQRFEARDGGVYTELKAIALTRNVPFELQMLVRPILQHLPRTSMIATLQKTREAVCASASSRAPEIAKLETSNNNSSGPHGTLTRNRRDVQTRKVAAAGLGIRTQH